MNLLSDSGEDPTTTEPITIIQFCACTGREISVMTKQKHDTQTKIRIIMEFLNTNITTAELCRKHNLSPQTFYVWKEKFLQGGKDALQNRGKTTSKNNTYEIDNLKKIMGELTIVNDVLKKPWRETKGEYSVNDISTHELVQVTSIYWNVKISMVLYKTPSCNLDGSTHHTTNSRDGI